jgi:hypothetical protein
VKTLAESVYHLSIEENHVKLLDRLQQCAASQPQNLSLRGEKELEARKLKHSSSWPDPLAHRARRLPPVHPGKSVVALPASPRPDSAAPLAPSRCVEEPLLRRRMESTSAQPCAEVRCRAASTAASLHLERGRSGRNRDDASPMTAQERKRALTLLCSARLHRDLC